MIKMENQLVLLDAVQKMSKTCGCEEKTCEGGKAMRPASLMALDAVNNSSGE